MDEQELILPNHNFFLGVLKELGIISHPDQERMVRIAKCVKHLGPVTAVSGAIMGAKAGVPVPGLGVVTGALAGAIAGLAYGGVSCYMLDLATIQQLRILSSGHSPEDNQ